MEDKEKSNKEKRMKIIVPIISFSILMLLFFIKSQNPNFALKYVVIIGVIVFVLGSIAFWGAEITNKISIFKKQEKEKNIIPAPASQQVLWEKVKYCLTNEIYRDHIKDVVNTINHSVGKNNKLLVLQFITTTLNNPKKLCNIFINANYPDRMPTIMFDPNPYAINRAIQGMSFDPEDPANEEETIVKNDMTGITATTKKKIYSEIRKLENKKDKEPLI